jgi:GAF domain-containing protein
MTDPGTGSDDKTAMLDLSAALHQMAGVVLSRETVQTALQLVATLAATTTAGTMGAGVTLIDEHGKRSQAASSEVVEQADALQYDLDEGPCLTAWRTGEVVRVDDTTTDARWPRWNESVQSLGVRSVISAPLVATGEKVGAMKVYCERPCNYGPRDDEIMRLLADQAAILLANSQSLREARRLSRQLTDALGRRDAIARATGVLLAQGAVGDREAFGMLTAAARRADRPVEDVARALLDVVGARNAAAHQH